MNYNIVALYFSPTKNTEKCVKALADGLSSVLTGGDYFAIDITPRDARRGVYDFGPEDIVIVGMPVYAGRIPNKISPFITDSIYGDGSLAIPLVTYGNRAYDDSLKELATILYDNGCDITGSVAALGEHSFSEKLATGRPDAKDLEDIKNYGINLGKSLLKGNHKLINVSSLPGRELESSEYYVPLKKEGTPAKFLKAMVETDLSKCTGCKACKEACPMDNYRNSLSAPEGICIKCQGCIKACPEHAKRFTDEDLLSHIGMIEENFKDVVREIDFF